MTFVEPRWCLYEATESGEYVLGASAIRFAVYRLGYRSGLLELRARP